MPDEPYTLSDLASLADVTPRTIRYYVAQGLLPSPEAAGPATRYGEGHLARLRLIRRLQRDHLPLAEIRARLEPMGDDEIARLAGQGSPQVAPPEPAETLEFVQALMARTGIQPRATGHPAPLFQRASAEYRPLTPDSFPLREEPAPMPAPMTPAPVPSMPAIPAMPAAAPAAPAAQPVPAAPGPRTVPDRSTWERVTVTPDVEINVRRPLDRQTGKKVEQLLRIARELFDEEP